jgi:UDP-GlcNAc:undecaprenyl-phosphate GlcNAc-1-phosphate transferase
MKLILFLLPLMVIQFFLVKYFLKQYLKFYYKFNIISAPSPRSVHDKTIPSASGVIFASIFLIFLLITNMFLKDFELKLAILKLIFGAVLIIVLGYFDDKYNLKATSKLIFQLIISVIMFTIGVKISFISNPFGNHFVLGNFSFFITVCWYIFVINSMNLIDGLDGLACGISIISCLTILVYSFINENLFVIINCSLLLSSLFAFFLYNFPNAKLFMGDSGSLFLGYFFASIPIIITESQFKGFTTFTLLIPISVLIIPFTDTIFTILRRLKNKEPIFKADKKHLHHQLLKLGLSKIVISVFCWFITLCFGIIALGYIFVSKTIMIYVLFSLSLIMILLFIFIYKKDFFKRKK